MNPEAGARSRDPEPYLRALQEVLRFSEKEDYRGYNKHDALNSPLLWTVLGWTKWSRILAIQLVMRCPWNLRPLLRVPRTRNPKGVGLFAHACLDLYAAVGDERALAEAGELLGWLLDRPAAGFGGLSWGYPYPWQDLGFFAPSHFPNRVVTCWIGAALVEAVRFTGDRRYLETLPQVARFLTEEPNVLHDDAAMKCYSYVPDARVHWAVMDVPALVGAYLAEAGAILARQDFTDEARRLLNWVADKQTAEGAWYYTHPPERSLITHDNYHTAIILDCFDRFREATEDDRFDQAYWRGLDFYARRLFTVEGAPRWMSNREYPYDIHGSASGALCFFRAAGRDKRYEDLAWKILDWALARMYDGRGAFYYQRTRWRTNRLFLMRWCNGWMSRALAAAVRYATGAC